MKIRDLKLMQFWVKSEKLLRKTRILLTKLSQQSNPKGLYSKKGIKIRNLCPWKKEPDWEITSLHRINSFWENVTDYLCMKKYRKKKGYFNNLCRKLRDSFQKQNKMPSKPILHKIWPSGLKFEILWSHFPLISKNHSFCWKNVKYDIK